ncbi:hypothetical protein [Nitrosomonas sp.]|uniref:hypothetical protein n=1 Tax=Nitrosomonas sp. TaxID=42353 RepID=UPI0025CDC09F|nr:hypothetical protein [Nitrosomonas sp.]
MLKPSSLNNRWIRFFFFCSLGIIFNAGADSKQPENLLESICPKPEFSEPRRRPGTVPRMQYQDPTCRPNRLSTPRAEDFIDLTPVPDRWRIVESLGYPVNWLDPYNGSNPLKGDRPVFGDDWFVSLNAVSSSRLEVRDIPTTRVINNDVQDSKSSFRPENQFLFNQNFSFDTVIYKGDTVFRPPEYKFRFTPVINYNQINNGSIVHEESSFAVQSLYAEKYLRDASAHYDFDSIRVGIQPFTSDFRGFLLLDQQLGVRLFGTRANNTFQYNFAWFRRLRKNNQNQNDLSRDLPDNDVFLANLYWQDLFKLGFMSQFIVAYNRSREKGTGIIADDSFRGQLATFKENTQHDYDVAYLGYNGDGRFGRVNLTTSIYYVVGKESKGIFVDRNTDVRALFGAGEISIDFDWLKPRLSALYASGDDDPFDHTAQGFDGISENPIFAGTNFGFFNRQGLPLLGNTINLKRNNTFFNALRSQADPGQSNFTNPGINMIGLGVDINVLPELRISLEANQTWFDKTAVLEAVLGKENIARNIGQDISLTAIYRPFATQNLILSLSAAALIPGKGYQDIYGGQIPFSIFSNIILSY